MEIGKPLVFLVSLVFSETTQQKAKSAQRRMAQGVVFDILSHAT